jgi:hypothetical protein
VNTGDPETALYRRTTGTEDPNQAVPGVCQTHFGAYGEPVAVKACAVSLGAGSPLQGAEVREEVTSGPPVLPGRESARGQQHGGKAWSIAEASKVLPRKARVIWRRPDCLKPSLQRCKRHTL